MPAFPLLTQEQAGQFNNFMLARRGPTFPPVGGGMMPQQIATLQNTPRMPAAMVRDKADELEAYQATVPTIVDPTLSDTELLKQQMSGGASALFDTSGVRQNAAGGMDYGKLKPIRGGSDEVLSNPKFIQLLRRSPQQAAQAYSAITGRDLRNDFQQRQTLDLARRKDMTEAIRGRAIRGEDRFNEETGFFERRVSIPDPKNPMAKVDAWETMDTPSQIAYNENWETAMGSKMAKPNPIATLQKSPRVKAMVMSKYMAMVKAGTHTPAAAFEEALKTTPDDVSGPTPSSQEVASPQAQAANQPYSGPIPVGTTGMMNIAAPRQVWQGMKGQSPMAGPAGWTPPAGPAYDAWANEQARANLGGMVAAPIAAGLDMMPDDATGPGNFATAIMDWNRMSGNARTAISNIPSHISAFFGGNPSWNRPQSKEEMLARMAQNQRDSDEEDRLNRKYRERE